MRNYQFKATLWPSIAFIMILPLLLSLGFWQLGRMDEKQAMFDALAQGEKDQVQTFPLTNKPLPYSKVKVLGRLLPEFSIFLEHQMHNSQAGYHVLTPLLIASDLPLLWVNRGWVSLDNTLNLQEPLEPLTLTGLIYYPSENRFILGENFSKTKEGQLKIQRMDFKSLEQHFHQAFYPYVLLLDPKAPEGFVRDWQIKSLPPSKHLGYAVQWFALAGTLCVLYIFVNLRRKAKND